MALPCILNILSILISLIILFPLSNLQKISQKRFFSHKTTISFYSFQIQFSTCHSNKQVTSVTNVLTTSAIDITFKLRGIEFPTYYINYYSFDRIIKSLFAINQYFYFILHRIKILFIRHLDKP